MMTRSRELEVLAGSGWLTETPASFRDAVLARSVLRHYRRGDAVYRTGDPPGGLFGLVRGGIVVELSPDDREPYFGTFVSPGFWIGEGSVLTRGPRFVGIRAARESVFAYLPLVQWDTIAEADPEAYRWLGLLTLRNSLLSLAVVDALMTPGAAERMAAVLLVLSRQAGPTGPASVTALELSQDDLATMANLSRSSAGRILQELESLGLIETRYREVRVRDPDGLRAYKAHGRAP